MKADTDTSGVLVYLSEKRLPGISWESSDSTETDSILATSTELSIVPSPWDDNSDDSRRNMKSVDDYRTLPRIHDAVQTKIWAKFAYFFYADWASEMPAGPVNLNQADSAYLIANSTVFSQADSYRAILHDWVRNSLFELNPLNSDVSESRSGKSSPNIPVDTGRITGLNDVFQWHINKAISELEMQAPFGDRARVADFISQHFELLAYLKTGIEIAKKHFGSTIRIELDAMTDLDTPDNIQLIAFIYTELTVDEANQRLEALDCEWYLGLPVAIMELFNFSLFFV